MSGNLDLTLRLLATVLLIGINALYVFHEFAFVAIKPGQLRKLDQDQSKRGRLVSKMAHRIDHYIAVDQLGITVSSLAVGWTGQPVVTDLFNAAFGELGLSSGVMTLISAALAFALLTGTQMIVGELMPKSYALRNAEQTAGFTARAVEITAITFYPFVALMNGIGLFLVRLLGFKGNVDSHSRVLPAEELVISAQSSARAGLLKTDLKALTRLINFSDLQAHDLMVPRMDVVAISADASFDEVLATARQHQFDRYPVYQGSRDEIVGIINFKDLLVATFGNGSGRPANWLRSVRPIPTVPESASVEVLLATLQTSQQPMALLVDEFGATEGLVTVTDITRQLIEGPDEIHQETAESVLVDGHASVSILESELGIELNGEERISDTIAGLVLDELGEIPEAGDTVTVNGHGIDVVEMDGHRITSVRIRLRGQESNSDGEEVDGATPPGTPGT
ncbi:MAG: HlyC/CorC family transporter [Chloroflexia bacterium]|nr:HlyC/CorC family transporter [Chloroflexia bacterium]MDQ3614020.1 hemolysin family protein [Chloroflexota bacterium]